MRKLHFIIALVMLVCSVAQAQSNPAPSPSPQRPAQPRPQTSFDLSEYGVQIKPEPRLIVVMAALDAAGFDPTPAGEDPSPFRAQVRKEQAGLDEELRRRLQDFYRRNKLPGDATPAEQAARYVSLAYAIGPAPMFEAPARTDDLPGGLLEVLDFAPLVREFYRKSGIDERLPLYMRMYEAEGERLRRPAAEMVRNALSYLHTRPLTTVIDRIPVQTQTTSSKKKDEQPRYTVRERERRFFIVPDLLAVPGAINFRVIADDYYAIAPLGTNPASSELRRAYLQYVVDPIIIKFNKDIAARRDHLKQLLAERTKAGATVTPDVFYSVGRSLVAAADARLDEAAQLDALAREMRQQLDRVKDPAARETMTKDAQARRARIMDETIARLADAYEGGAVLSFYFADQLRGIETSGFDIANFFADMIASFDPVRETKRLDENATARSRAVVARRERQAQRTTASSANDSTVGVDPKRSALIKKLIEVDEMLRLKNYEAAETRLRALLQEYPGEPRVFFALGEAASLSARDAIDEDVQSERLTRALAQYRMAIQAPTSDTDPAMLSHAYEAMGRILAFLDEPQEAMKAFDAAIKLGPVPGGAYNDALAGKKKLTEQK